MISVCIPVYEQAGSGARYLDALLQSIRRQKDIEFDVIVSDNSAGTELETLCAEFAGHFPLRYLRNPVPGVSNNSNNAIAHATHDFIKIMYQDDLLIDSHALAMFADALTRKPWAICSFSPMNSRGFLRPARRPVWPRNILCDNNTFGMPSIMALRRDDEIRFDPKLKVRLDCEYYWLFHKKYGPPEHIDRALVGCRYWRGSISRVQGNHLFVHSEAAYLMEKHMGQTTLTGPEEQMKTGIASADICTDINGNIVPRRDRRAAFVLVGKGREIPQQVLKKYGDKLFAKDGSNPGNAGDTPAATEDDSEPEPEQENSSTLSISKIQKRRKRIIKPTGIH